MNFQQRGAIAPVIRVNATWGTRTLAASRTLVTCGHTGEAVYGLCSGRPTKMALGRAASNEEVV